MNDVNIKDYLTINKEQPIIKNSKRGYSYPEYTYEVILDNGCDLIFRRTSRTGIQRDLTIIPSENLIYIRDVKKGVDKVVTNEGMVSQFFQMSGNAYCEMIKSIKNPFFHTEYPTTFASRIFGLTKNSLARELLKRGLNPLLFFRQITIGTNKEKFLLDKIQNSPTTFFKILKYIEEHYEDIYSSKDNGIPLKLLIHVLEVADKINTNNAIWMLNRVVESNSTFELPALDYWSDKHISGIVDIVEKYNLNFQSYINYLFFDLYTQGINAIDNSIISLYDDTLNMQTLMYDGKVRDKYPKHLKETHDKVMLIYNLNLEYFEHKEAVKLHNECKQLEYSDENYCIITPEDSSELINEGISLHHCVGSYVEKVNKGKTSVLFLRKKETPNESLITIEYKDGVIKQVRGLCERLMDNNERKFFDKWTKRFKLCVEGE